MELKEFIDETLTQIIDGVKLAQGKGINSGAIISPSYFDRAEDKRICVYNGEMRVFTDVHFEVALTASAEKEGKGGIGVWFGGFGIGGQEKTDTRNVSATSVRFSVPISLPVIRTETAMKKPVPPKNPY